MISKGIELGEALNDIHIAPSWNVILLHHGIGWDEARILGILGGNICFNEIDQLFLPLDEGIYEKVLKDGKENFRKNFWNKFLDDIRMRSQWN